MQVTLIQKLEFLPTGTQSSGAQKRRLVDEAEEAVRQAMCGEIILGNRIRPVTITHDDLDWSYEYEADGVTCRVRIHPRVTRHAILSLEDRIFFSQAWWRRVFSRRRDARRQANLGIVLEQMLFARIGVRLETVLRARRGRLQEELRQMPLLPL